MKSIRRWANWSCLLLLVARNLAAQMTHNPGQGVASPDEDGMIFSNGFGAVIQEPAAPPQSGQKPHDSVEKTPAKGGKKPVPLESGPAPFPVYLFADGPSANRVPIPDYWRETELLIAVVKKKVPGAAILQVRPFSLARLESAWRDARARHLASDGEVSSILVFVNGETSPYTNRELQVLTSTGYVRETQLHASLEKFGKTISDHIKPETVLLTSYAGAIDCSRFPGPVFGMTPSTGRRDLSELSLWLGYQIERYTDLFPATAREFYNDWAVTNHVSRRRYFYCPYQNGKGYLGYKTIADPLGDNGGVEWKVE